MLICDHHTLPPAAHLHCAVTLGCVCRAPGSQQKRKRKREANPVSGFEADSRVSNQVNGRCLTTVGQAQAAAKLSVGVEPFI